MKLKKLSLILCLGMVISSNMLFANDDLLSTENFDSGTHELLDDSTESNLLLTGSDDSADAENSTQSAKAMNLVGEISVNELNGDLVIKFPVGSFGGINLDISYNNLGFNARTSGRFGLPKGLSFSGIPFIEKINGSPFLVINGQSYKIDGDYASAYRNEKTKLYHSGLRYQTSLSMKFIPKKDSLVVNLNGVDTKYEYENLLKMSNGDQYYFNKTGLLIGKSDKFFTNDAINNEKHITLITYRYSNASPDNARIREIKDMQGYKLKFIDSSNSTLKLVYPEIKFEKDSSTGEQDEEKSSNYIYITKSGSEIQINKSYIQNGDIPYDIGMTISDPGKVNYVRQGYFKPGSRIPISKGEQTTTVIDYIPNDPRVKTLTSQDRSKSSNQVITKYSYSGPREKVGGLGEDIAYNSSNKDLGVIAFSTTVEKGNRQTKHCYNALNEEILTEVSSVDTSSSQKKYRTVSKTYSVFPDVVTYDSKRNTKQLFTNYNQAIKQLVVNYDDDKAVTISQSEMEYDDYGQMVSSINYPMASYNATNAGVVPEYELGIEPVIEEKWEYSYDNYGALKSKTVRDLSTKSSARQENILDGAHVLQEKFYHNNNSVGHEDKIITYTYASDNAPCPGSNISDSTLICSETITKPTSGLDTYIKTNYKYELQGSQSDRYGTLTTTKTIIGVTP